MPSQGVVTNFEIFRMREKQVPVDVVEMKGKMYLYKHRNELQVILISTERKLICFPSCCFPYRKHHSVCMGAQWQ